MNKTLVFLDMDGVLVDLLSPLTKLDPDNVYYKNDIYPKQYELGKWDIFNENVFENLTENFWSNLPWTPDGKKLVEVLENRVGKENIFILSQSTGYSGCLDGKYKWIKNNLPDYTNRYLLGKSKYIVGRPGAILIDDSDMFTQQWNEMGGISYLVPRLWNSKYNEVVEKE